MPFLVSRKKISNCWITENLRRFRLLASRPQKLGPTVGWCWRKQSRQKPQLRKLRAERLLQQSLRHLELPRRFVALVFDDSHMKVAEAMAVHAATEKLFATLTPTDRVAIYSTQGNVQQDYTADAARLRETLAAIVPHPAKGEGQYECPNISYYQADLISNKRDGEAIQVAKADALSNGCPVNLDATAQRIL